MTLDDAVRFFATRIQFSPRKDRGSFLALLDRLGNPHRALRCVHIAGTNGKGSVTTLTAAILTAAGYKVGAYLSPYVFDLRERWMIDGAMIPEEVLLDYMDRLLPHVAELDVLGQVVTEFELKTAIAFLHFAESAVDLAVIEVGIGGRLDSTNVIDPPLVSAITSIGLDHIGLLGDTLGKIASEKAGILKRGTAACVTPVRDPEALVSIQSKASEEAVPIVFVDPSAIPNGVTLSLKGPHQRTNAATATTIAEVLRERCGIAITDTAIRYGLEHAFLPGRFQLCLGGRLILDAAHNADGAEVLIAALRETFPNRTFTFVIGTKKGHTPTEILDAVAPLTEKIIATEPPFKPTPVEEIVEAATARGLSVSAIPETALAIRAAVSEASESEIVVVTGSFYVIGETPEELRSARSLATVGIGEPNDIV